jgi:hypothetical protein
MPTIMRTTTFAAAGSNPNVNNGSIFETARRRQVLSMGIVQTVTANFAGINVGPDVVAEEFEPFVLAAVYPIIPDHFFFTDVAEVGDRIVIFVRATVAVTYRSVVVIADA